MSKQSKQSKVTVSRTIHEACKTGKYSHVAKYCGEGSDLNVLDDDGRTPLLVALLNDKVDVVELLLREGARWDIENGDEIPLHVAAARGHATIVTLLLEMGAGISSTNKEGKTALEVAKESLGGADEMFDANSSVRNRRRGTMEAVKQLERAKQCKALHSAVLGVGTTADLKRMLANDEIREMRDSLGRTALHIAAGSLGQSASVDTLQLLLSKGMDAFSVDRKGNTPLHYAIESRNQAAVEFLVKTDLNRAGLGGRRPLHVVSAGKDVLDAAVIGVLLQNGADAFLADDNGDLPVDVAIRLNNIYSVRALLPALNAKDRNYTLLHDAARSNNVIRTMYLLMAGANKAVTAKSNSVMMKSGKTPLEVAQKHGNKEVEYILDDPEVPLPPPTCVTVERADPSNSFVRVRWQSPTMPGWRLGDDVRTRILVQSRLYGEAAPEKKSPEPVVAAPPPPSAKSESKSGEVSGDEEEERDAGPPIDPDGWVTHGTVTFIKATSFIITGLEFGHSYEVRLVTGTERTAVWASSDVATFFMAAPITEEESESSDEESEAARLLRQEFPPPPIIRSRPISGMNWISKERISREWTGQNWEAVLSEGASSPKASSSPRASGGAGPSSPSGRAMTAQTSDGHLAVNFPAPLKRRVSGVPRNYRRSYSESANDPPPPAPVNLNAAAIDKILTPQRVATSSAVEAVTVSSPTAAASPSAALKETARLKTFKEKLLREATGNFASSQALGANTFFGNLSSVDLDIVVKRVPGGEIHLIDAAVSLHTLRNDFVLPVLGVCLESSPQAVVYAKLDSNLRTRLRDGPVLTWKDRIVIARDIVRGVTAIHELRVLHRGLTDANILIDSRRRARVGGYWLANDLSGAGAALRSEEYTHYDDPKFTSSGVYNVATEVFAVGMILLQLATGKVSLVPAGRGGYGDVPLAMYVDLELDRGTDASELVDPLIVSEATPDVTDQAASLIKLARKTTRPPPFKRINLAALLEGIEEIYDMVTAGQGKTPTSASPLALATVPDTFTMSSPLATTSTS